MRASALSAALAVGFASVASAQTFTDCNPLEKTTCPTDPALGRTVTVDFTKGKSSEFTVDAGTTLAYDSVKGAAFTINAETNAPTIESNWYIFFGKIEVVMQAAPGVGIVSSFVLESDDLDEVDWEWLGGDTTEVQTNYFGKGNTTSYDRGGFSPVAAPQTTFQKYGLDWTAERIIWSINDVPVRTLAYADALGGKNYPQTPMRVKMGNWVGGSSTAAKGTVQWAGGLSTFPGSYTMYVQSVTIQDYTTSGTTYAYGDTSGSWESIVVSNDGKSSSSSAKPSSSSSKPSSSSSSSPSSAAPSSSGTKTSSSSADAVSADNVGGAPTAAPTAATTTFLQIAAAAAATDASNASVSTGSLTTGSIAAQVTTSDASPKSKYGWMDITVGILGLGLGYLVM